MTSRRIDRSVAASQRSRRPKAGGAGGLPARSRTFPRRGEDNVPIRAAPEPDRPRAGFAAFWRVPSWRLSRSATSVAASIYVFRNISPLHVDGLVVRLADPPVAVSNGSRKTSSAKSATRFRSSTRFPAEFAPAACLDPPSEEEVWNKVPKFKNGCPPFYETQRNNVRILIEKIGEKIDPCKVYPARRTLPARPLPLQVHGLLRRAVLVGLSDPVQPRRSQGRGRLLRQGPPPPLRRSRAGVDSAALIDRVIEIESHRRGPAPRASMLGEPVPFDVSGRAQTTHRPASAGADTVTCGRRTGRSSSAPARDG